MANVKTVAWKVDGQRWSVHHVARGNGTLCGLLVEGVLRDYSGRGRKCTYCRQMLQIEAKRIASRS